MVWAVAGRGSADASRSVCLMPTPSAVELHSVSCCYRLDDASDLTAIRRLGVDTVVIRFAVAFNCSKTPSPIGGRESIPACIVWFCSRARKTIDTTLK